MGIGGFPRGRIVEIFGPANCGKTALALQSIAHLQQSGGGAAWIDVDHTFDPGFAAQLGVHLAGLPVAEPATAEEALEMTRRFTVSRAVDLVVIDSAAALVTQLELKTGIGGGGAGLRNRVLASELRRLAWFASRAGACIVFLNQTRARMEPSGELETSAGGPSLKLHASVRIALSATGRRVRFRVLKNNLAAAFTSGELEWHPGSGFAERR